MSHLTDRTLEKLINGSASPIDVQRIRRHVDECRACARRIEEWRDHFAQLDERYPELSADQRPSATVTSDGMVLLPGSEPRRRMEIDLTTGLWIGAGIMALLVVVGTYRLHHQEKGVVDFVSPYQPTPGETEATHLTSLPAMPPTSRADSLRKGQKGSAAPATPQPALPPLPVSEGFKSIRAADAVKKLGGPLRTIRGLRLDHAEIGPASAVPGAQSNLDVVRLVYRTPDGDQVLFDQQRIPADSSGFRPIEDQTLESGETSYVSSPAGSVATWLDSDGYRLSLTARATVDSLKALTKLVH
jgi:hypothetical protein